MAKSVGEDQQKIKQRRENNMERKFTKEVLTDVAVAALTVCGFGLALAATIRLMFMIIGVY